MAQLTTTKQKVTSLLATASYHAHSSSVLEGNNSQERVQQYLNSIRDQLPQDVRNVVDRLQFVNTNQDMISLVDHADETVYNAYRGTIRQVGRDFLNYPQVILDSTAASRQTTAVRFSMENARTYPGYSVVNTGHSLGGTVAETVAYYCHQDAVLFNPGGSFLGVMRQGIDHIFHRGSIESHYIGRDPLSMTRIQFGEVHHHQRVDNWPTLNNHDMSNFMGWMGNRTERLGGISFSTDFPICELDGVFTSTDYSLPFLHCKTGTSYTTAEDFAVALYLASKHQEPAFSLDPWDPQNPQGPWLRCVYYPDAYGEDVGISNTRFAQTMFEADWLMKQLSLGVDASNLDFSSVPTSKLKLRQISDKLSERGFKDLFDLPSSSNWTRMWIVVDHLEKDMSGNASELLLENLNLGMRIKIMRQEISQEGILTDTINPEEDDPNCGDVKFVRFMTENYALFEESFPCFKRLRQLAKLYYIAKVLVAMNVPLEMNEIRDTINEEKVNYRTPIKVPALKREVTTQNYTRSVFGGVSFGEALRSTEYFEVEQIKIEEKGIDSTPKNLWSIPFLKKNHCLVCGVVGVGDDGYCHNHNPEKCFKCEISIRISPEGLNYTQYSTLKHGYDQSDLFVHSCCFNCDTCLNQITGSYVRDPLFLMSYYHPDCTPGVHFYEDLLNNSDYSIKTERNQEINEIEYALIESLKEYHDDSLDIVKQISLQEYNTYCMGQSRDFEEELELAMQLSQSLYETENQRVEEDLNRVIQESLSSHAKDDEIQRAINMSLNEQNHAKDDEIQRAINMSLNGQNSQPIDDEIQRAINMSINEQNHAMDDEIQRAINMSINGQGSQPIDDEIQRAINLSLNNRRTEDSHFLDEIQRAINLSLNMPPDHY